MSFNITLAQPKDGEPIELIIDKPADYTLYLAEEDRGHGRFYLVFFKSATGEAAEPNFKVTFSNLGSSSGKEHWVTAIAIADHAVRNYTRNRIRDNREH